MCRRADVLATVERAWLQAHRPLSTRPRSSSWPPPGQAGGGRWGLGAVPPGLLSMAGRAEPGQSDDEERVEERAAGGR